jgi:hypothetical protein
MNVDEAIHGRVLFAVLVATMAALLELGEGEGVGVGMVSELSWLWDVDVDVVVVVVGGFEGTVAVALAVPATAPESVKGTSLSLPLVPCLFFKSAASRWVVWVLVWVSSFGS